MIQSPGLVRADQIPKWLADVQIVLKTGWTEEQLLNTSLDFKRKIMTYIRGEARGLDQKARREANRGRNRR